jgi:trans-AT polyketide synthase, acyltransferase and oxidoreductase domains
MDNCYLFPGQGSQYVGMGKNVFEQFPRELRMANDVLGYDIKRLCLEDHNNNLKNTKYSQPAIYLVSCLEYLEKLKQVAKPDYVLGHSLGEYGALFAAEVFDLTTGLRLIKARAQIMSEQVGGAMLAVLGVEYRQIQELLVQNQLTTVNIANYNTPSQHVLSGLNDDIDTLCSKLEEEKIRHVKLKVSGAFHSHHMEKARIKFAAKLLNKSWSNPTIKIISSSTCDELQNDYILEELQFQLVRPVYWYDSILSLSNKFVRFEEVGPGQVLTRMNQEILKYKTLRI